jgi:hypothetical protein
MVVEARFRILKPRQGGLKGGLQVEPASEQKYSRQQS